MSTKTFNLTYTQNSAFECSDNAFEKTGVIIVAAGNASRMGGQNKVLTRLCSVPVIVRTVKAFEDLPFVEDIVVVTRDDMVLDIQNLVSEYGINKVKDIVVGGNSRGESVKCGFERLKKNNAVKNVLIHDGVRPLVTKAVIEDVVKGVEEYGSAVPAVLLKDTVKEVGALGKVVNTPDRQALRLIQTPQGFKKEIYAEALEKAGENLDKFTDDSAMVEKAGFTVYTTLGDYKNIKITTPEDLALAAAFITLTEA